MNAENKKATETKIKFLTCFNLFEEHLNLVSESYYREKGIDVDAFKKMLIEYQMEEYTDLFLSTIWSQKGFEEYAISIEEQMVRDNEHLKSLTETLHFILSKDNGKDISLTFYKSRNKIKVSNTDVIDTIIKSLIYDFEKNQFNLTSLTNEEAEEEMDKGWIDQWINEQSDSSSINYDFADHNDTIANVKMIKAYADSHYKSRDVTLEFLSANYKKFTKQKSAGAKAKNTFVALTCRHLSYLKRIDEFLKQDEIKDIEEFSFRNNDYKFIHDCMVSFRIIEDKTNNAINTTTPEIYIRTILHQTSLHSHNSLVNKPRENINYLRTKSH